jgi:hypothetical protein
VSADVIKPPADVFLNGSPDAVIQFQTAVMNNWSDCGRVFTKIAPVWNEQQDIVTAMLLPEKLDGTQYLFLLHLLIGLASGTTAMRALAQRIVDVRSDPDAPENPTETFINLLTYVVLMELADPKGSYRLSNQQLQSLVSALANSVTAPDPCSVAIKASLLGQGTLLFGNASYPSVDADYPSVGFHQRKGDTLQELDAARATVKAKTPA